MVVAEVPLWVVHSNSNAPSSLKGNGNAAAAAASAASAKHHQNNANGSDAPNGTTRASESLRLLTTMGGGSNSAANSSGSNGAALQRAAIYGIDVHGSKFATGGETERSESGARGPCFRNPRA